MGNAAAIQAVSESSRRRLLLQQYNKHPNVLLGHQLRQLFQERLLCYQNTSGDSPLHAGMLPLTDIHDVISRHLRVQCTLQELPDVLTSLGCRVATVQQDNWTGKSEDIYYSFQEVVAYMAPRKVLRQVHALRVPPTTPSLPCPNGMTVWQAAKTGQINVLKRICELDVGAYCAKDDFENTPLYYASLCGRAEAVDCILKAYSANGHEIPPDEHLRCVTNALNQSIRGLLQQKMTLEEVLAQECEQRDSDEEEAGFGGLNLFLGEEDEE